MDFSFCSPQYCHLFSLTSFTDQQKTKIKSHLVDSNNRAYGTFPSFSPLYSELSLGVRIIDTFSDCFYFNYSKKKMKKMTNNASINLTQWLLSHHSCNP